MVVGQFKGVKGTRQKLLRPFGPTWTGFLTPTCYLSNIIYDWIDGINISPSRLMLLFEEILLFVVM